MFECLPYRIFWDLMRWFSNYVLEKSLPASFRWLEFFFHNHLEAGKGREGKGKGFAIVAAVPRIFHIL